VVPASNTLLPATTLQVVGIDGRGNAIVMWSEYLHSHSRGIFAAVHRS
jgi:hypothetical protein